jgi:uncharacterized membrane protein
MSTTEVPKGETHPQAGAEAEPEAEPRAQGRPLPALSALTDRLRALADVDWRRIPGQTLPFLSRNRHVFGVGAIVVLMSAVISWYALLRYWHFTGFGWDLEIFDQTVRGYAHFHGPYVSVLQADSPKDPGHLQLSDHFSPIWAVLAPLYWIHDSPANLLIAQPTLFALAIPAVWLFARRKLGVVPAYVLAVAFALAWPLQDAVDFDVHEVMFAVPLTAWMIERFDAGRVRQGVVLAGLLLLVKEDQGFVLIMFGLVLALRGARRTGAWLAGMGLGAVVLLNLVVLPPTGSSPGRRWQWNPLGATPGEAAKFVLAHPATTAADFFDPAHVKVNTLVLLLAPVLFLALRSRLIFLALPLIAERFLSDDTFYWGLGYHYNAFLLPILFLAAIEGAQRLPRVKWTAPAWALACLVVVLAMLPRFGLWQLKDSDFRATRWPQNWAISQGVKTVPKGAIVNAYAPWGAHLTNRAKVIDDGYQKFDAPWILTMDQAKVVEPKLKKGYVVRFRKAGVIVLELTGKAKP